MIKDIFGAISPSIQDFLVSFFLPQGSFILVNLILIAMGLGLFLLSLVLVNRYQPNKQLPLKRWILAFILLFVVGLFVTFLLAVIVELLLIRSLSFLLDLKKEPARIKESDDNGIENYKKLPTSVIIILLLFNLLFLGIFSLGGLLLAFLLGWWIYGWTIQIGVVSGLIILIAKKILKLEIFKQSWQLSSKTKKGILVSLLIIPFLFGSIFITTLLPNAHPSAPKEPTSSELTNLRIMTYNIRTGTGIEEDPANQWFNRKEEFVEYLDGFNLDIFGIQEAQYFQIQYIHNNLESREYVWTGKGRANGVHGGEACAIFFDSKKYEYIDGDTFWLSDISHYPSNTFGGSWKRVVTWVRLEVKAGKSEGAQFCVFNTHYDFADEWQIKASNLVNEKILEYSGGLPTILMGDFNLQNESRAFDILENYENPGDYKPMRDAYRVYKEKTLGYLPYATTSPLDWDIRKEREDKSRIDFIFISEHIMVNKCSIPQDSYDEYRTYSDHFPVYMNCTF